MNLQHMIPYANPTYFIWLMVGLLPMMLVLLFKQKRWQWYQTLLTLVVLYVSFGGEYWQQGLALIGYVVYQTLLVYGYYQHRQRANTSGVFYGAVVAAILPLALSKVTPFFVGHASLIYFLGISYLTFKSVQMIMEIRDGLIKEYHPLLAIVCLRLVSATSWVMIHQLTSINLFWRLISKNSGIVGT